MNLPAGLPIKNYVDFQSRARFFELGVPLSEASQLWICFHGYGHLAPYFLRKFEPLTVDCHVIVPEGLHRFYLAGTDGRVGASWMTKEERELDIQNYLAYVDAIVEGLKLNPHTKIVAFGFSQGATTAGRWAMHTKAKVDHLVLWSGMFPHDVSLDAEKLQNQEIKIHAVIGDTDEYINDDRFNTEVKKLESSGVPVTQHHFNGGHEIPADVLRVVRDKIPR